MAKPKGGFALFAAMESAPRERSRKTSRAPPPDSDAPVLDEFELFRRQSLHGGRTAVKRYVPTLDREANCDESDSAASSITDSGRHEVRPRMHKLSLDNQRYIPAEERKLPASSLRRSVDRLTPTHSRIAEVDTPTSPGHSHCSDLSDSAPVQLDDIKICHLNSVIKDTWSSDAQAYYCSKSVRPNDKKEKSRGKLDKKDRKKTSTVSATYYVQVLGSASVGKSTLCSHFAGGCNDLDGEDGMVDNENEAEEDNEFCKSKRISVLLDGEESTLVFLHTFAQTSLEQISIISGVHAYLVVYAIDDQVSFQFARATLEAILINNDLKTAAVLVANKSDLARCKEVKTEDGKALAARYSASLIETSATLQHHVDDLLIEVLKQIRVSIVKQTQFAMQSANDSTPIATDFLDNCQQSGERKGGILNSLLRRISRHK